MSAHSKVRVLYVSDDNISYQFKQDEIIQQACGNTLASGTEPRAPQGLRMRHINASWFADGGIGQAVGKFSRRMVIGSVSNPLWTHADTEVQLEDRDSVPGVGQTTPLSMKPFTVTGRSGESVTF